MMNIICIQMDWKHPYEEKKKLAAWMPRTETAKSKALSLQLQEIFLLYQQKDKLLKYCSWKGVREVFYMQKVVCALVL